MQGKAEYDKQAAELIVQTGALQKEKERMTAIGVADNDILELNVGGTQFAVKRTTLTQVFSAVSCLLR